jgi:hypothetical protein
MSYVPDDDDLAEFSLPQRAESIFQGRLPQSQKKKSSKVYWIIGGALLFIYIYTIYFYQSKIDKATLNGQTETSS